MNTPAKGPRIPPIVKRVEITHKTDPVAKPPRLLSLRVNNNGDKGKDPSDLSTVDTPVDTAWHHESEMTTVMISGLVSVDPVHVSRYGAEPFLTLRYSRQHNNIIAITFQNAPLAYRGRRAIIDAWVADVEGVHSYFPTTPTEPEEDPKNV